MEIKNIILVQSKYNYPSKVQKALQEGNKKYIQMLIKKGKMVITTPKELQCESVETRSNESKTFDWALKRNNKGSMSD